MAKIIKHFITNITPKDKRGVLVYQSKDMPVVTNDFIQLSPLAELGITKKGFNLNGILEYSITAVEE